MESTSRRPSLVWTLFLIFLFTSQVRETDAGMSLKLKKILKRVLLLRALTGKKGLTIIPIPIPLNLFMKEKTDEMKMMEKMMQEQPMPPYPMYMPMEEEKMTGYPMMMQPKENHRYPMMMPPKENPMPQQGGMMMGNGKYGMMRGD